MYFEVFVFDDVMCSSVCCLVAIVLYNDFNPRVSIETSISIGVLRSVLLSVYVYDMCMCIIFLPFLFFFPSLFVFCLPVFSSFLFFLLKYFVSYFAVLCSSLLFLFRLFSYLFLGGRVSFPPPCVSVFALWPLVSMNCYSFQQEQSYAIMFLATD